MGEIDPAQSGYWSVRESFVSIVLTNMPMVYPLFKGAFEKGRRMSKDKSYSSDNGRAYRLSSLSRQKGGPHKHPLSLPNDTAWDSNEDIVVNPRHGSTASGDDPSLGLPIHRPSSQQALNIIASNPLRNEPPMQLRPVPSSPNIVITRE